MPQETSNKIYPSGGGSIPGPQGYPILGVVPKIGRDVLGFFKAMRDEYGDVVRLDLGARTLYLVTHPDDVKYVLQDNNRNYAKGYEQVKPVLGEGLVSSEGDIWRRQRRLIQPNFHRRRIAEFSTIMVESAAEMLESWKPIARRGEPLDIAHAITAVTQQIIAKTMFSTDVGEQVDTLCQAFDVTLEFMNMRMFNPIPLIDRLPTPGNLRFRRSLAVLNKIMYGLIEARRLAADPPEDLLTMLINARDEETGEGMTDKQIRDEVVTIFFAGHETTASTLSWSWYLLAQHPEIAGTLQSEAFEILEKRTPTIEDYSNLVYARRVIDESLRIYPPAWMFARQTIKSDEVGGYHIPADAMIMLSPYITHRHPDFWEKPEQFDPSRFIPERIAGQHRMAYFPFGGGPRLCIGKDFALVEATLILAQMARAFQFQLVPGRKVVPQPIATLRPRPGVFMTIKENSQ
jgi:cytochrome P450